MTCHRHCIKYSLHMRTLVWYSVELRLFNRLEQVGKPYVESSPAFIHWTSKTVSYASFRKNSARTLLCHQRLFDSLSVFMYIHFRADTEASLAVRFTVYALFALNYGWARPVCKLGTRQLSLPLLCQHIIKYIETLPLPIVLTTVIIGHSPVGCPFLLRPFLATDLQKIHN